jgi:hypothetical protein
MSKKKDEMIEQFNLFVEANGDFDSVVFMGMGSVDEEGHMRSLGFVDGEGRKIHHLLTQLLDNNPELFTGLMFELLQRKCDSQEMFDKLSENMPEWPVDDDTVAETSYKWNDTKPTPPTLHTLEDLLGENDEK